MIYNFNTNALPSINVPSSTVSFVKYVYSYISKNISSEKVAKKKKNSKILWSCYMMLSRENNLMVNKLLKGWPHVTI